MPRTELTEATNKYTVLPDPYADAPFLAVVWTAANEVDGNAFRLNGQQILLVRNLTAGVLTATITQAPDSKGRAETIAAINVVADGVVAFSKFPTEGWRQADGMFYITGSAVGIEIAILDLRYNTLTG